MRYTDVLKHFGSEADIAVALGRTRQAVNLWKQANLIPEGVAYQLQVITAGKLRVDPAAYHQKRATA